MSALVQQTPEWLEMRKNKIGASDAPVIMGVSPWMTPYSLWETKIGIRKEGFRSEAMQRGLELEESARKCFEEKTGIIVFPEVVFHQQYEWMMASLDGIDIEKQHIVEIKCAGGQDHAVAMSGKVPEKYFPQLQHQLEVTGLDMAFYFSFDGNDGIVIECPRNTRYIKDLLEQEKEFFKCMCDFIPPKLSEKDYNVREDEEWMTCIKKWKDCQKALTAAEMKEKELRNTLISLSGGVNTQGGGVSVTKVVRKGTIEYGKIPQLNDVDLEKYRKDPVEFWRIGR